MGPTLCNFVTNCLNTLDFPPWLNDSLITLIPKVDNPDCTNQFRPITLCNVAYKVISKIIVKRLRPLLHKLVGPYQASFMPDRQTKDNIIITQEIIHTLEKRKYREGGIILKIDLEKAYDMISWSFWRRCLITFILVGTPLILL